MKGSHLHVVVFVTGIKGFLLVISTWLFPSDALDRLIFSGKFKGQIAAVCSWSVDFRGHLSKRAL